MSELKLTMAFTMNERSRPVIEGRVKPDGITLDTKVMTAPDIFYRQLKFQEFDVSEMSISSLLVITAKGESPWVALPVFTQRHFFQNWMWVRSDAGIDRPEDLKGKRMGVPEYQQTAALWSRGILEHEYGVHARDMEWFMERSETMSHGGASGFRPPEGVKFSYIPPSKNIGQMMMDDELDATMLYVTSISEIDRSRVVFENNPKVRKLFVDQRAESVRYFQKTGIFPINHCLVVRRSIYEQYPWIALNLFNAFRLAKEGVLAETRRESETHRVLGLLSEAGIAGLAADPYPYGVKSNLKALETATQYSFEQGLTTRKVSLDEVFAPQTLDL
ncbi:MAG: PhnD/SsuA/transferrin family substrate-binding protein [Chloroflexota bacterium]